MHEKQKYGKPVLRKVLVEEQNSTLCDTIDNKRQTWAGRLKKVFIEIVTIIFYIDVHVGCVLLFVILTLLLSGVIAIRCVRGEF